MKISKLLKIKELNCRLCFSPSKWIRVCDVSEHYEKSCPVESSIWAHTERVVVTVVCASAQLKKLKFEFPPDCSSACSTNQSRSRKTNQLHFFSIYYYYCFCTHPLFSRQSRPVCPCLWFSVLLWGDVSLLRQVEVRLEPVAPLRCVCRPARPVPPAVTSQKCKTQSVVLTAELLFVVLRWWFCAFVWSSGVPAGQI